MSELRRRTSVLLLAVLLGHVILISAQVSTGSRMTVLQAVTFTVFSQLQRATASITGGVRSGWDAYLALRGLRAENEVLRREMETLRFQIQERRALVRRSLYLERLLELRSNLDLPTAAADVIAADATPWFRTVTIDKGRRHGLRRDMAVMAPTGVVGRTLGELGPTAAKVQLLIDRNAAAGAVIVRSGSAGVVVGVGENPVLRMEYVSNLEDVQVGDLVVTSGIDGIYPRGFAIGRVTSAKRGVGLYRDIDVEPAVDFTRLEGVLVVLSAPPPALPAEGTE